MDETYRRIDRRSRLSSLARLMACVGLLAGLTGGVSAATGPCAGKPAGTVCRLAAGPCDVADVCDGTSSQCPDVLRAAGAICRPSAGPCDMAEACNGRAATCPADARKVAGMICRPATGPCDIAEKCTGSSATCPADRKEAAGTACTDDRNACTQDVCDGTGICLHSAGNAGTICRPAAGGCDVAERCSGISGDCPSNAFQPNGTVCDDGNVCTMGDTCEDGTCTGGQRRDCDDRNPCTDDSCDAAAGCIHTPNTGPCNDGNPCTDGDTCEEGRCVGQPRNCPDVDVCDGIDVCDPTTGDCLPGTPLNCDDGVVCTADHCDPVAGCVRTLIPGCCRMNDECDDHDVCTGSETCDTATGTCQPGISLDCADDDLCTDDSCDPLRGCLHTPIPGCCGSDEDCEDQNPCTITDTCDPSTHVCHHILRACSDDNVCNGEETCDPGTGDCVGGTPLDCHDGVVCTTDSCDPVSGCTYPPIPGACNSDEDCDDHNACTGTETYDAATGLCKPGTPLDCDDRNLCTDDRCDPTSGCVNTDKSMSCDDRNPCTTDACDPAAGCTHAPVPGCCLSDAGCLDQDFCNGAETCVNLACVGGVAPDCDDHNPCTDDTCDAAIGCLHMPNIAPCDDGDACTTGDTCRNAECHGVRLDCDDHNPCTDDSCSAGTCMHSDNEAPCSDGNACTRIDACRGGMCVGEAPVVCVAQDQCHEGGTCDPVTGHCSNPASPNTVPCDDGNTCTGNDHCDGAGLCVGQLELCCADGLDNDGDGGVDCADPDCGRDPSCVRWACPLGTGFWKTHPGVWPVFSLTLGSRSYTRAELLTLLRTPVGTGRSADASLLLATQLIAAKLDVAHGSDPGPISAAITSADSLLNAFAGKLPYKVRPSSSMGQAMLGSAARIAKYKGEGLTPNCTR